MDAKQVILHLDPWLQQMWAYQCTNHFFSCAQIAEQNQTCICENRIQMKNQTYETHCVGKSDLQRIAVLGYEE